MTNLKGLPLADSKFNVPAGIDLLIGSDLMERVLLMESRTGAPALPLPTTQSLAGLCLDSMGRGRVA